MIYLVELYSESRKSIRRHEIDAATFMGLAKAINKIRDDDEVLLGAFRKDYNTLVHSATKFLIDFECYVTPYLKPKED